MMMEIPLENNEQDQDDKFQLVEETVSAET